VFALSEYLKPTGIEFNVEGYPSEDFLRLMEEVRPVQATLVPDPPEALTSSAGWDTVQHTSFLREVVVRLQAVGIRTSLFLETAPHLMDAAAATGTNRVELYTGPYAHHFPTNSTEAVRPYVQAGHLAAERGLGLNAGHDLDRQNLRYFVQHVPQVLEVSIGHALVCDALYLGLAETLRQYRECLA
jgi:pyridoxine 5-phosphate synthase